MTHPAPEQRSPWPPTRIQVVAAIVGLLIGLSGAGEGSAASVAIRLPGYVVAVAAIVRWVGIVRHRWTAWFVAHQLAMAAIVVGWVLADRTPGVVVNGLWLVIAAVWYWAAGRGRSTS